MYHYFCSLSLSYIHCPQPGKLHEVTFGKRPVEAQPTKRISVSVRLLIVEFSFKIENDLRVKLEMPNVIANVPRDPQERLVRATPPSSSPDCRDRLLVLFRMQHVIGDGADEMVSPFFAVRLFLNNYFRSSFFKLLPNISILSCELQLHENFCSSYLFSMDRSNVSFWLSQL